MLDEKDLQAIAALMDSKLLQQKREIIGEVKVLMESYFDPKFNLLAEDVKSIHEKISVAEEAGKVEARVDVLESVVRIHSQEIEKLKRAQ